MTISATNWQVRKHGREKWITMCERDYNVQKNYKGDSKNMLPYYIVQLRVPPYIHIVAGK